MLLPGQFHLDAFEQPAADAIQRLAHTLLGSSQSVGDFAAAKVFDVTKFKQFLVRGIKFCLATSQGSQIGFHPSSLGFENGLGESIQRFVANVNSQTAYASKNCDHDLRRLSVPREEAAARPKRLKLAPRTRQERLVQVIGVFPVPNYRKDVTQTVNARSASTGSRY